MVVLNSLLHLLLVFHCLVVGIPLFTCSNNTMILDQNDTDITSVALGTDAYTIHVTPEVGEVIVVCSVMVIPACTVCTIILYNNTE